MGDQPTSVDKTRISARAQNLPARCVHSIAGDRALLPPSPADRLDASVGASGPHDFAVRVSAVRLARAAASTVSRPTSVTIAIRPSLGTGWRKLVEMICPTG
jgi:hypothetical protein